MSTHEIAFGLAYFGSLLGVIMVVPQIIRTIRHPHLTGVAPMAWAFTSLACLLWLVFGIRTDTFPQIPGNVLLVSGAMAIVLLVPSQVARWKRALMLGSAATTLVVIAYQIPPHTIGYFAFAIGLYSMWPQLYTSVWVNRGGAASGLSISTWTLKVVSQSCWFAYAILLLDFPVIISATFGISTTVVVLAVETSRRQKTITVPVQHLVLEPA